MFYVLFSMFDSMLGYFYASFHKTEEWTLWNCKDTFGRKEKETGDFIGERQAFWRY